MVQNHHMHSWHLYGTGYCTGLQPPKFKIPMFPILVGLRNLEAVEIMNFEYIELKIQLVIIII
jgi:hypothetical protein